jgi:lambda repressor-like predicted transcriptional regulator
MDINATPKQVIDLLNTKGLNLTEISRLSGISMSILSTVQTGRRQWPRYPLVDKLRALLVLQEPTPSTHHHRPKHPSPPLPVATPEDTSPIVE